MKMPFCWEKLPLGLRARLLQGGVGRMRVMEAAQEALKLLPDAPPEDQAELYLLARDMLFAAWEGAWQIPAISASLSNIQATQPFLPPHILKILHFCAKLPRVNPALRACGPKTRSTRKTMNTGLMKPGSATSIRSLCLNWP
jgi:hypothetical protein